MADAVEEADLADPNPDIEDLFQHYDRLYFQGALADAGFTVKWGSGPTLGGSSFGSCTFSRPQNTITLSEPVLQYRPCADRKSALLHFMIHAIVYIKHQKKDCWQHGPVFRDWMDAINSCSVKDHQRPDGGYNITTRHDFSPEQPRSFKGILWKCESCGDTLLRATNLGPPSDACCIENVNMGASCGNMLCHWHKHKNDCCGAYEKGAFEKMMLESGSPQKKVPGGAQLLLTSSSDMFKTEGAIQESGSSELQGNTKATKRNAEDKHLSLVISRNRKPQGSSSSTKAGKRHRPEVVPETGILRAQSPRKLKGKQDVAADGSLLPLVSGAIAKSPRSSTSKKVVQAVKQHKPEDVQKPNGLPDSPEGKPNQKHGVIAVEKRELLSVEGNDAISPGSDTSKKAGKQHKPDDVQKPSVLPSAPLGTTKLPHASVATEKDKLFSPEGYNDAKPQERKNSKRAGERHEPLVALKACSTSTPAYPQKRLKQEFLEPEKNELSPAMGRSNEKILDKRSSRKEHRQHEPEGFKRTTILPAALGSKQKASGFVASEKQRKGKCKTKPAREKEYVVMCAWLDVYESDRSSGSTKPLVNKRTERRRRERERERERERARILTYSRSKKNPASLVYSRTDASVSNHRIKTLPCKDESKQQSQPPPPCSETTVSTATADQAVVTHATGDHSQPSAPCLDIVPLQPAAPPGLTSPDQSSAGEIIDISDDD
ncbi:unnamed protein product [Urochloa humidicola]